MTAREPGSMQPASIEPRVSLVTLGVADLGRSRRFYEALGWRSSSKPEDGVVFFQSGGMVLALWSREELAKDFPHVADVEPVYEAPRPGDVAHSQASIEKIVSALGYAPTHQIADGMAETVNWFAQRHAKARS